MTTRRPLTIWLGSHYELGNTLRAQGHKVYEFAPDTAFSVMNSSSEPPNIDLIIGPTCWHLPENAPNPDAHVDRAVAWMQRKKYGERTEPKRSKPSRST